jgi:hypothetical protein
MFDFLKDATFWKEMATSLAGTLVFSSFALCAALAHSIYIGRKYPVRGRYVTHFEDLKDGKTFVRTSMSHLKQRGRRIFGKDVLKDGRTWLLEGSIMGIGHIGGVYSAEATDDEGVGSFYLRIKGQMLEGLWSGYDHENKRITSGKYVFRRLIPIKIRPLRQSLEANVLAIAAKVFGPNYLSAPDLAPSSGLRVYVAWYDGKIVGFAAIEAPGKVSTKLKAAAALPMDVQFAEKSGSLGIIKTIAVVEGLQSHGIGDELFLNMDRTLRGMGMSVVAVPAWKDAVGVHLSGILSGNGYEQFLSCQDYWKDECESEAFKCPCKQSAANCACSLIWYKKA